MERLANTVSEKIVNKIVLDFTDRRGLSQEWDMIDSDIREEIISEWKRIAKEEVMSLLEDI